MSNNIPDDINRNDVLKAILDFDSGVAHDFAASTGYDLHHNDSLYPPKAIIGLAARRTTGRPLTPIEFSGGEGSKCFRVLRKLGFTINPKTGNEEFVKGKRNPPWERDETILALDLYFRHPPNKISQEDDEVIELSELLNRLPIHKDQPTDAKFRNPNGVYMKMCNFLTVDPNYDGVGLKQGSKLDQTIWDEFAGDRDALRRIAVAIGRGYATIDQTTPQFDDEEDEFPEGRVLYRLHRSRERNATLVKRAKKKALQEGGLFCVICCFDFYARYGEIGHGFIECHHTEPISEYEEGQPTKLEDLALVCANCHRMLHRRRPWLTINELKSLVTD